MLPVAYKMHRVKSPITMNLKLDEQSLVGNHSSPGREQVSSGKAFSGRIERGRKGDQFTVDVEDIDGVQPQVDARIDIMDMKQISISHADSVIFPE